MANRGQERSNEKGKPASYQNEQLKTLFTHLSVTGSQGIGSTVPDWEALFTY